ncbi:DUF2878 domain-containing protein [Shewanella avicenniae]|uniref:DUF2878 domain-containing protein n=1 Tax=Shewanella avicenniae TaxID=2814294 RepID=A0ABX7QSW2_9GAMM|nr:DUF2878 domain-containing protein [Shewanella avicenniae]QSX34557.1 DUF2878 domain-containing protein [Shewanella avicenniae]
MKALLLSSCWFQCLWFAAVVGREAWQWLTLTMVILTLLLSIRTNAAQWRWSLAVALFGIVLDSINQAAGFFVFNSAHLPWWMMSLWLAFAWYSWWLSDLLRRYPVFISVLLGALAGMLSYLAGAYLQAVMLPFGVPLTAVILFCQWGVLIGLMLAYRGRFR